MGSLLEYIIYGELKGFGWKVSGCCTLQKSLLTKFLPEKDEKDNGQLRILKNQPFSNGFSRPVLWAMEVIIVFFEMSLVSVILFLQLTLAQFLVPVRLTKPFDNKKSLTLSDMNTV